MNRETKHGRHGSSGTSPHNRRGSPATRAPGSVARTQDATDSETRGKPRTGSQSTTATAMALARWENEGGRVVRDDRPPLAHA